MVKENKNCFNFYPNNGTFKSYKEYRKEGIKNITKPPKKTMYWDRIIDK